MTAFSGASAPSFAQVPAANAEIDKRFATSASAAERISKSAEILAKRKLSAYVLSRYSDVGLPTRERFSKNFEAVAKIDPTAEMHPVYLLSLEKKIVSAPSIKEDGALF